MDKVYGSYKNGRDASWRCLIDYKIKQLPVDVFYIAACAGIKILANNDVDMLSPEESAISFRIDGEWYIVYDDTKIPEHILFSIAHEEGHIFLGHPLEGNGGKHTRQSFAIKEKPLIEMEADVFARDLLMPACVLWALNLHTWEQIANICGTSPTSAKIRAKRMQVLYKRNKFLISSLERQVYKQFKEYINKQKQL